MSDDYCDFCDLPLSTCVHGMPKPSPALAPVKAAAPRRTPVKRTAPAPARNVARKWTPPETFRPHIVALLQEAGGSLPAEELFAQLEARTGETLREADHELTPEGELRWRYAARRARQALIADGWMTKGLPGVWELASDIPDI